MGVYVLSARAQRDKRQIRAYLVEKTPLSALRILDEIDRSCQLLADNPHMGRLRPDWPGRGTRCWPAVTPYLIVHRPIRGGVRIVRMVDGRQDLRRLFGRT